MCVCRECKRVCICVSVVLLFMYAYVPLCFLVCTCVGLILSSRVLFCMPLFVYMEYFLCTCVCICIFCVFVLLCLCICVVCGMYLFVSVFVRECTTVHVRILT